MNFEALIKEKEEQFNELLSAIKEKEENYQKEVSELQNELLRLQGEYRLLVDLQEKENPEISEEE